MGRLSFKDTPAAAMPHLSTIYASMLRRCAAGKSLEHTKAVHAHMYRAGFPYLAMGNKLLDAYLKSGSLRYARRMFDEMPARHIVSWNSMISCFARRGMIAEALSLLRRMPAEGASPDGFTFASVFGALTESESLRAGRQVHAQLVVSGGVSGAASPLFVATALVNLYAKLGCAGDARLVYDRAAEKDVVLGTAMVVGLTRAGENVAAARAFADMVKSSISPNEFTLASVLVACGSLADLSLGETIHGLAIKAGLDRGTSCRTSLLVMYSRCSLVEAALEVYSAMTESDLNLVARTAAMGVFLASQREEEALSSFKTLLRESPRRESCRPNAFALSTALRACASLALLRAGEQVHAVAVKIGLGDADRFVGASLVDVYGKCGMVDAARSLFDGLVDDARDVVALNCLISGYAANGRCGEALKLFGEATTSGLQPSDATFTSVLTACSAAGMVEEGRRIFAAIGYPTREHVSCFADLLARGGRLEEAERLLGESQVAKPDAALWRTLLGACKLRGEVEMAERAAKRVLELRPGDDGTVVLLTNVYAAAGRWDDVVETKRAARGMGLKKEPAVSWIEVGRRVHSFVAGDRSHPQAAEIYETLEALMERTRGLGYAPDARFVLQLFEEEGAGERSLYYHSEKLAVAFAVLSGGDGPITVFKNLRVCGDCHSWLKVASAALRRRISARDAKKFHHFSGGTCSCGDYW